MHVPRAARRAGAVLVSLALIAGCGDDSDAEYPLATQRAFMDACEANSDTASCQCALDKIEQTMSYQEFKREETAIEAGRPPSRTITDAISDCRR